MPFTLRTLLNPQYIQSRLPWVILSLLLGTAAVFGAYVQTHNTSREEPTADSFLDWFRYPITTGSKLELPSSDLRSVRFAADSQIGWAVGDDGLILHTRNGGETWTRLNSNTSEALMSVTFANGSSGWVVGTNGTIRRDDRRGQELGTTERKRNFEHP